jgi:hypothetical protein
LILCVRYDLRFFLWEGITLHIKHLENFLSVYGGHLVCVNISHGNEKGSCTYLYVSKASHFQGVGARPPMPYEILKFRFMICPVLYFTMGKGQGWWTIPKCIDMKTTYLVPIILQTHPLQK